MTDSAEEKMPLREFEALTTSFIANMRAFGKDTEAMTLREWWEMFGLWLEVRRDETRMQYFGTLGLLAECAVYVPEDLRESIERAMADAAAAGLIRWRRILNRIEAEPT